MKNLLVAFLIMVAFFAGSCASRPPVVEAQAEQQDVPAEPFSYVFNRMLCAPSELMVISFVAQGFKVVGTSIEHDANGVLIEEIAVLVHPLNRKLFVFETRGNTTCIAASGDKFRFTPEIIAQNRNPV